jgi:hypothetical protein
MANVAFGITTSLDELVRAVRSVVNRHADWRRTARLVAAELTHRLPSPDVLIDEPRWLSRPAVQSI